MKKRIDGGSPVPVILPRRSVIWTLFLLLLLLLKNNQQRRVHRVRLVSPFSLSSPCVSRAAEEDEEEVNAMWQLCSSSSSSSAAAGGSGPVNAEKPPPLPLSGTRQKTNTNLNFALCVCVCVYQPINDLEEKQFNNLHLLLPRHDNVDSHYARDREGTPHTNSSPLVSPLGVHNILTVSKKRNNDSDNKRKCDECIVLHLQEVNCGVDVVRGIWH